MRSYAAFGTSFWTKGSGKRLRGHRDAQLVGAYLISCGTGNLIGIYYLPLVTLCHELGMSADEARAALAICAEKRFAFYDEESELAWVPNMAQHEIGETMAPRDKRRPLVLRELRPVAGHRFGRAFIELYGVAFGLIDSAQDVRLSDSGVPTDGASADPVRGIDGASAQPDAPGEARHGMERKGEVQEGGSTPAPVASSADPPPAWFVDTVAGIALATGEELRVPECWLRYAGHRASKPDKRAGPEDARYWVTSVCVPEARRERQRIAAGGSRYRPDEAKPQPYYAPAKSALDVPLDGPAVTAEQMAELARGMP